MDQKENKQTIEPLPPYDWDRAKLDPEDCESGLAIAMDLTRAVEQEPTGPRLRDAIRRAIQTLDWQSREISYCARKTRP